MFVCIAGDGKLKVFHLFSNWMRTTALSNGDKYLGSGPRVVSFRDAVNRCCIANELGLEVGDLPSGLMSPHDGQPMRSFCKFDSAYKLLAKAVTDNGAIQMERCKDRACLVSAEGLPNMVHSE